MKRSAICKQKRQSIADKYGETRKNDNENGTKIFYRQLAFAVFAALTPHRQLLAPKCASPFCGSTHPPPDKRVAVQ